jgi:cytochrome c
MKERDMKHLMHAVIATLAFGVMASTAHAAADGAKLYVEKTCVACHGKDAKTPVLPDYPKLAGQSAAYAEKQMKDIKSGARANGNSAAMKGVMHLVNDDEIKVLAQYLSSLK